MVMRSEYYYICLTLRRIEEASSSLLDNRARDFLSLPLLWSNSFLAMERLRMARGNTRADDIITAMDGCDAPVASKRNADTPTDENMVSRSKMWWYNVNNPTILNIIQNIRLNTACFLLLIDDVCLFLYWWPWADECPGAINQPHTPRIRSVVFSRF